MGFDLGPVDDWVEEGAEYVGEGIEEAGDFVASGMEEVGMDRAADWVRDGSRSVANRMGADTDELELGQTEDPKELIHGSEGKLHSTASHLKDFAGAFDRVGNGLKRVDNSDFKGEAAEAFRAKAAVQPKKWFTAAEACRTAAGALTVFAETVGSAQKDAQRAIDKWLDALAASKAARAAYNTYIQSHNMAVEAYNTAVSAGKNPGPKPPEPKPFDDPGPAMKAKAREILNDARKRRNEAEGPVRETIQRARDMAPPMPSSMEQLKADVSMQGDNLQHYAGGLINGAANVLSYARSVSAVDPYNLTHPATYVTNLNSTALGLYNTARNPQAALDNMLAKAQRDPTNFLGVMGGEALATKGAGFASGTARRLASAGRRGGGDARGDVKSNGDAHHATGGKDRTSGDTDPVDLATGRMFLPQTDVALPGVLPLVFRRHVESGYRAGGWFGPSWTSTVDQRLEVDCEGVIFVSEDGRLLAYPHPVPGVATLPSAGAARMPLERMVDGGYTLTDAESGWVRHFGPPQDGVDGDARIEQLTDRSGHHVSFEWDVATGAPVRMVHSGGYELRFTLDEERGRITGLWLARATPDGRDQLLVQYGYTDEACNLTEVAGSSGQALRFGYDDEHRVTSWTDTNECHYDYVYDNQHRVIAEGGTAGHFQVRIDYDSVDDATGHRVTRLTTPEGHVTRYLVNDRCQIVAVTDPLGNTTRTQPDRYNRPLRRVDALGQATAFAYDEAGHLAGVTRPDGREITVERDELGLPTQVQEADGAIWAYTWDACGNRTAVTDPAGHTTHYGYDTHGHLASVTNALGETTHVACDPAGLPVAITDPLGATLTYERDAFGRPVTVTDPVGAVTRLAWTVEGKLARREEPDRAVHTWEYDGEGNCTRHIDPTGGESVFEYTDFDLLAARTGPDGVRHTFDHDTQLRLTRVTNPHGLTWTYDYDPAGRLVAETDFDGRTHTYTHDASGHLTSRTNPLGETTTLERDPLGQIIRKDAAGAVTTFTHDSAGRLIEAAGPDAEIRWQRDKLGRPKTELTDAGALTHTWDPLGRPVRRVTPTGAVTTYTYDPAGNRASLSTHGGHTLDFTHDAAGRESARHIDHAGLTLSQLWDPAGRLTEQTLSAPGRSEPLQHRAYTYRADGYLTGIDDQLAGPTRFDLDDAGRVTTVHAHGWHESYAYDQAGNQTHATWPRGHAYGTATGDRAYTGTRLTHAGRIRYHHDAAGRLISRHKTRLSKKPDTWHYTWNAENHLTHVTTPDGTRWRYQYDPLGRRTAKQRLAADGATVAEQVTFTWDGPVLVEQTTTAPDLPNPITLTWDHHGHTPLTQTERRLRPDQATQAEIDARFYAIITDLVGTPTELVDETGDIAWHTQTTLWGTTTWNRDATTYTPLRFPGQYYDPETGLHYNHHRYYDPTTARYTTPDPLGLAPAPNPTTYPHNPHTWTDVLGLAPGCPRDLGLSASAQRAIEKFENLKKDPLGDINSQPDHNHYDAARREANGEVVARKNDGTPFDHITELREARGGLNNIRVALEKELLNQPSGITDRGLEVLSNKYSEVNKQLNRLNGYLQSIGHR